MNALLILTCLLPTTLTAAPPAQGEPTNATEAAAKKAAAEKLVDEQYAAWVSTLPPAQQAWERVLQENLGGFYLPIHKRQKVAGRSNAAGKHGVVTDDLFNAITPSLKEMQNPRDVHFNAAGYEFLGQRVAEAIVEVLR